MKNSILSYLFIASIFFGQFGSTAFAQTVTSGQTAGLPKGIEKVVTIEGITEYRLQNGLKVLLYPDASKPTAIVSMVYMVGSRNENYGETGMAHLLEHLLFKGTPTHKNIPGEFSARGALSNGQTTVDRTNYYEQFNATDENLEWAIGMEADRMVNSYIAKKDLDSEMTVVRNEMERGENSPGNVLNQRVTSAAYRWHNYANSPIGSRSDVENVPIERLQAFYKTYYQPDNAVLLVGGKIDTDKTLEMIAKHFGPIPKPTRTLPKFYTVEPTQDGERTVTVRRSGDSQLIVAAYHLPSIMHEDMAAITVIGGLMAGQTGALYKGLVETKKANSAIGRPNPNAERSMFYFNANLSKDQNIEVAQKALTDTVENYSKTLPSEEDVNRSKDQLVRNVDNYRTDVLMFMGAVLPGYVGQGDWRLYFLFRDRLKKVTPEDVQRVAAKYFVPSNRTVGVFIPTDSPVRAEIPEVSNNDVAALLDEYKGGDAVATGEEFDPSPQNIESRVKRLTTPSGIELALLPKKTRGGKVNAIVSLYIGNEKALLNRNVAGLITGSMLMRGSSKYTRLQISEEMTKNKIRAGISGDATRAGANIDTIRESLVPALKLAAEVLKNPTFSEAEFEDVKRAYINSASNQQSEPQRIADSWQNKYLNQFPKGDVRAFYSPEDMVAEVKKLTLDDIKQFHRDFYGASAARIAIVGDFDEKAIVPVIEELFGGWKSKTPFEPANDAYFDVAGASKTFETPDKANAYFSAAMNMKVGMTDADYPALLMGNHIFGGAGLSSRITGRIRGKEGLSYSVRSALTTDLVAPYTVFKATAIVAPENMAKLEVIFKEELETLLKNGVTAQELAAAKNGYLQQRVIGRGNDNSMANKLRDYLFADRTLAWDAAFEKAIADLTVDQVNAALRKYLVPSKLAIAKAGDFAKVSAAN